MGWGHENAAAQQLNNAGFKRKTKARFKYHEISIQIHQRGD
jgi:hypothetical protein